MQVREDSTQYYLYNKDFIILYEWQEIWCQAVLQLSEAFRELFFLFLLSSPKHVTELGLHPGINSISHLLGCYLFFVCFYNNNRFCLFSTSFRVTYIFFICFPLNINWFCQALKIALLPPPTSWLRIYLTEMLCFCHIPLLFLGEVSLMISGSK